MKPFTFVGKLPPSKSILNRLLLVQSYSAGVQIRGDGSREQEGDDVRRMRMGLQNLHAQNETHVGSAATVLRFLAFARFTPAWTLRIWKVIRDFLNGHSR